MSMSKSHLRGFTFIELIVFIVVVSAGLTGILTVMNVSASHSADPMLNKQAAAIAESLLEEILLKDYSKPTGSTVLSAAAGGTRTAFDCVSDYNTYSTTGGITDILGSSVAGLTSYNIAPAVTVTDVVVNGQTMRQIVVSVTGPQGVFAVTGYRGNY